MFFNLILFLQQFHAAKATNSVGQMNNVVAFSQIEKAIDGSTLNLLLPRCWSANIGPAEQFVVANHHQVISQHLETTFHMPKTQRNIAQRWCFGQQFFQSRFLTVVMTGDQHMAVFPCEQ